MSWWCHPTFSSSVAPFASCPQSFPASRSSTMSQLFTSHQSIGASASASVLPMNLQSWFPLGLTGLIFLPSKGLSESSPAPQFESINSLALSLLYGPTFTFVHDYWKNHSFDYMGLCQQSNVSVFKMLSKFVIAFLPRSKHLLISLLQSPSPVILEPKKIKLVTAFHHWSDGTGCQWS